MSSLSQRLNYYWRLIATALAFSLFGIGGIIIPAFATPLLYLITRDKSQRQRYARGLAHYSFRFFIHTMRLLGILSWSADGLERLQNGGKLLLANHPTLLDVVFLVAFIRNANCVVKGKLLANPAMHGFVKLCGYITNDSSDQLLDVAKASLAQGDVLIVFPEGTRTRVGQTLNFQRGSANIAVRGGYDITPVLIQCSPATLSKQHKWYHIPERRFHMSFAVANDIAVAPFMEQAPSRAARQLTTYLEHYFEQAAQ